MYINAYKETQDNLYLIKDHNILLMISFEIEEILDKDDVCETAKDFLPKLNEIKQLAEKYKVNDDVISFIRELKSDVHLETDGFKFLIERTPSDHIWVNVEYDYIGNNHLGYTTYTSVIEHIDDID